MPIFWEDGIVPQKLEQCIWNVSNKGLVSASFRAPFRVYERKTAITGRLLAWAPFRVYEDRMVNAERVSLLRSKLNSFCVDEINDLVKR
ncbi:hypothetical protein CEXT_485621 [Caerostris extrusa]|uniref:Reverse transcriptase n=1 Tax=Caerostris extrusa TaxID=172846 RepID=A0AAV4W0V1_CAEEX|nr:hypothetical protein CEXT_485621 [Caerostris extrusa]